MKQQAFKVVISIEKRQRLTQLLRETPVVAQGADGQRRARRKKLKGAIYTMVTTSSHPVTRNITKYRR